jgi:hypothetical protein
MAGDDHEIDVDPTGRTGLESSVSYLTERFGRTDSIPLGLTINTGTALIGVVGWYFTTGLVAALALGWAVLNLLAIVAWVIDR